MKHRFGIPVAALSIALFGADTPAKSAEKSDKPGDDISALIDRAGKFCGDVAVKAKDIKLFNFCFVEIAGPLFQGPGCVGFVSATRDPGYQCDRSGALYYEIPG